MLRSFKNALRGIAVAVKEERNMRIILVVFMLVVAAGIVFGISVAEWAAVLICCALVICAEMVNTSIENAIDLCTKEYSPLAKKAKDIAAGATLTVSLFSAAVGLIIFIPRIIDFFSN